MEKQDKINLGTYIAFSYVAIGDTLNAQKQFENILTLNADYSLNEEFVSPKITHIFLKAKERISFLIKESPQYYVINPSISVSRFPRQNLIFKSAFVPGWGQFDREEKTKGIVMGSVFASSLIGAITTYIGTINAKDRYYNATVEEDALKYYDEYNLWSKINRFAFDVTLSVYLFNLFDIIW
ncbi:TPA: hypothetical protein DCW38_05005 [candidate division WOR-3 bacterium]|jgi:hypothetical protein|uniref:DUF5683 domain-containing protein n=1 Tax=candidate division WOR-3 bacterium TaxID=2052148 RepID=A0A350HAF7_UNCW3|nr:hypothetical protein [candidate division WOR-3 bacterium]